MKSSGFSGDSYTLLQKRVGGRRNWPSDKTTLATASEKEIIAKAK